MLGTRSVSAQGRSPCRVGTLVLPPGQHQGCGERPCGWGRMPAAWSLL